jgi:hypothetical protein
MLKVSEEWKECEVSPAVAAIPGELRCANRLHAILLGMQQVSLESRVESGEAKVEMVAFADRPAETTTTITRLMHINVNKGVCS